MKVMLTSCGLETERIQAEFLKLLDRDPISVKALFIPTAAIDADAIAVLPKCMNDLLKCGIPKDNIDVYDLHKPMSSCELTCYDVVYLCGGNTRYLLERINEQGFHEALLQFIEADGCVLGVSAGSIIFAANWEGNLGLLKQRLDVHCDEQNCEQPGELDLSRKESIMLGNLQAIVLNGGKAYIFE